ncbi:cyclin-dependent kinase inhibitor 3 family protein [Zeimonas arvi]|uniref:Phosphatase n=1 Tax=Zeimonas arvi TaxID=2498847 RepID=A0A5C8NTA2_9BURK|nr:cyclin-dependent kinase inhibitor 3 family protein [Zeimonas arvi]TXL64106.1 phosphatase [Zeimonas arvi]
MRTSETHPLRIDEIAAGSAGGVIGITFCPGKQGDSYSGAPWARDLEADLDAIARWQPGAMLTLIEDHEFDMLGVPRLGERARARGIAWHHLPIVDVQPPDERFESLWVERSPGLVRLLRDGGRVLVHCRGGLGRAGTVAALLLVGIGLPGGEAVRRVRAARPGAIETAAQLRYVMDR